MKNRKAGMMLSEIPFSNMPVLLKKSGFDFFIIDDEHGGFDYSDVSKLIMTSKLCGLTAIVRLPDNTRRDVTKFMDMGADGLMLPMTSRPEDVERVVRYARYAPAGMRGISTMRAHTLYDPPVLADYMRRANASTRVYAQIETVEGVKNIREILSLSGVDGFLMGPNDLSCDYGCVGEDNAPQILSAIDAATAAAVECGKESGIITGNKNYLARAKKAGMELFCVGSELSMLARAGRETVAGIRAD